MAKRPSTTSATEFGFIGDERLVVVTGKEEFLKVEAIGQLKAALASTTGGEVETLRFEGKTASLADVLDEVRSFGLVQQYKMVVVDDADPFITKYREQLERYAGEPVETATLVLRAGTWNAAWRLHKQVEQAGRVAKCEPLKPAEASAWVTKRAKGRYERAIEPRAAGMLVERLGCDLGRLDSDLGKLAVSGDGKSPISVHEVEALVGRASEEAAWAIQEALLTGNAGRAVGELYELVEIAGQPDVLVMHFVADLVRKLNHGAGMMAGRASDQEICKALGVWGPRTGPFMAAVRKLGQVKAARLLRMVVEADQRSKTGFGDHRANLQRFCVQFAGQLR